MSADDDLTPDERAAALLSKLTGPSPASPAPQVQYDPALIPEADTSGYQRTETDEKISQIIGTIDIVDAYERWCGKSKPNVGGKTESVMISCPLPGHPDAEESAWLNTEKQVWYCGGCQQGGDKFDLAALNYGYAMPGYKRDGTFPKLMRDMAEEYGLQVVRGIGGTEYVVDDSDEPDLTEGPPTGPPPPPAPIAGPPPGPSSPLNVVQLHPDESSVSEAGTAKIFTLPGNEDPFEFANPHIPQDKLGDLLIDWESIVTPDTFLWEWMKACTIDDLPPEYYFWLGMQALGFAGRTDVLLADYLMVKPNLNVCTYGPTGSGKSRSAGPYQRLLKQAFPYNIEDHYTAPTGVNILATPGSSEALLDSIKFELLDPGTQQVIGQAPTTGLLKVEEFASFIARASRAGSSLKEIIIELYDILNDDIVIHSRGAGVTRVENPFIQMLTTTQPKAIHNFLRRTDTESGFLNRWVFAAGVPRVAPKDYGLEYVDIDTPAHLLSEARQWASSGHELVLAGDAREVWREFFNDKIAPMRLGTVEVESMMSRIDLIIKKLIVLFSINEHLSMPTPEVVQSAVALYPYLETTFGMFSQDINFSDNVECQNRLVEIVQQWTLKYGANPSRRDIVRMVGKKFDMKMVDDSMKVLVSMEVIIEEKPKSTGRGRPTVRYSYGA